MRFFKNSDGYWFFEPGHVALSQIEMEVNGANRHFYFKEWTELRGMPCCLYRTSLTGGSLNLRVYVKDAPNVLPIKRAIRESKL